REVLEILQWGPHDLDDECGVRWGSQGWGTQGRPVKIIRVAFRIMMYAGGPQRNGDGGRYEGEDAVFFVQDGKVVGMSATPGATFYHGSGTNDNWKELMKVQWKEAVRNERKKDDFLSVQVDGEGDQEKQVPVQPQKQVKPKVSKGPKAKPQQPLQ